MEIRKTNGHCNLGELPKQIPERPFAISSKQNQNFVRVQTLISNNPHKYLNKYKCDMYGLDLRKSNEEEES